MSMNAVKIGRYRHYKGKEYTPFPVMVDDVFVSLRP